MMVMEKYCFLDQESSTFFVFELWYNEYRLFLERSCYYEFI